MQPSTSKEDKQVDDALDTLISKSGQIKASISALVMKLEQEYMTLDWRNVLDNFALISGDINSFTRSLKNPKIPPLKNYAIIPLMLSPDVDPDLQNATEGRVPMFTHEIAPQYLRTKPCPEAEEKLNQLQAKAGNMSQETMNKQITILNKLLNSVHENVKSHRETLENDLVQKGSIQQQSSQADTNLLISAITFGKGLKSNQAPNMSNSGHPSISDQRMAMPQTPQAMGGLDASKAPSTVRTTIKAAANIHPYAR